MNECLMLVESWILRDHIGAPAMDGFMEKPERRELRVHSQRLFFDPAMAIS